MKKLKPIINSLIDLDLYKLTQMNAVIKKFPNAKVEYKFINRGKHKFPEDFGEELRKQIKHMSSLSLTKDEKSWLETNCSYLDQLYIEYLSNYKYKPEEVGIIQSGENLEISISGYWHSTILWETILMSIISELYFIMTNQKPIDVNDRQTNNLDKAKNFGLANLHFADFGTRRRFSFQIQNELIEDFKHSFAAKNNFVGTSNVYLAYNHNIKPIGTHAHEWFMFHGAKYGYKMANHLAMENWVDVYRGDLGIALSDTYTSEAFFKSFDKKFAKLFDGVRHDSGDAFEFTDKVIAHYKKLGIDPMSKVIVFSDGLNPELALKIKDYCGGKIMSSYGIGTNFSNDVGVKPLNIVIKMVKAKPEGDDWLDCIKLSDDKGKHTGDIKEIGIAKYILKID